jgi:uncharacterized protein
VPNWVQLNAQETSRAMFGKYIIQVAPATAPSNPRRRLHITDRRILTDASALLQSAAAWKSETADGADAGASERLHAPHLLDIEGAHVLRRLVQRKEITDVRAGLAGCQNHISREIYISRRHFAKYDLYFAKSQIQHTISRDRPMATIIGRTDELKSLQALYETSDPQFLAVYGRRRIGKTFLINEFFRDKGLYFELTGIKDAPLQVQLNNFAREYAEVFNTGGPATSPVSWVDAFDLLRKRVQDKSSGQKMILFFDELPWLASPRSQFLAALDHTWNRYLSRSKDIIVIICGSAASWMIKKVLQDKGGLHGRLTQTIQLKPFTLAETRLFLEAQQVRLTAAQLIEFYMAVGGVAKHLTHLRSGQSVHQLVQSRYFDKNAPLKGEFHKLFSSLFDNYQKHVAIVEALAGSHYGLTVNQLLEKTATRTGGGFSTLLTELLESGFLTFLPQLGNKKKAGKYLLTDEFTLFYLKWVRNWENQVSDLNGYWQRQSNTQSFRAWAGYAFETLCMKNIASIKQQLGIGGVTTAVSQWQENQVQIDLVIDRADNCINLCEIKFYNTEYVLGAKVAAELQRKKARFLAATGTKKALFLTLITANGVIRNQHYIDTIDSHVQANRFAEHLGEP